MIQSLPLLSDDEVVCRASSSLAADDESGFGSLATVRGHLPLESMDVRGRIDGLLARVTVRQTFINTLDEPLEAAYIFPLPDRSAVTQFRMEVAGRVVEGILEERGQARERYDRAITEGRRAAIAEEDRPGVFNLRVGNLMPGERATVELTLCGVLPYTDGEATFRFPLVVAPRFIPGTPLPGPSVGDGTAVDTGAVPDASRISPPVLLAGFRSPVRLSLEVELHEGGAEVEEIRCSLHAVRESTSDGYRRIRLYPGERLNRDFILRFRLGGPAIRSTLTLHPDPRDGREGTFALTIVPPVTPAESSARPRDVVFVLDRSGSMEGWKIVAARRALGRMIDTLNDSDRFCVMAFDNAVETPPGLPAGLSAATDRQRFRAVEYLATVNARGGTEMARPLDEAVKLLTPSRGNNRDRVLVLITDGQVGNEDQILQTLGKRLKGIRVFTLGIDRAVNEGFLRRLAEQGSGSCELVESEDRLDEVMAAVHRRIGTPLLTGLSLISDDLEFEPGEVVPRRLPDLFDGSPLLILGRYRGRPAGTLTIQAVGAGGQTWSEPVAAKIRDNPAIAAAWARGQIRQLEDRYASGAGDLKMLEQGIIGVSLRFQVLCRFTAYVAVDRSQVVNEGGSVHRITQPVEQPEGWADASMAQMTMTGSAFAPPPSPLGIQNKLSRVRRSREVRPEGSAPRSWTMATAFRAPSDSPSPPPPPYGAGPPDDQDTMESALAGPAMGQPPSGVDLPNRLEIREKIAAGAMGEVFKAFDRQRGQLVVVQVFHTHGLGHKALAHWHRVMEILSSLAHPAFIPVYEVAGSERGFWIVRPLVEGQILADRLRSGGRMDPSDAAALVAELAEALHLAHARGLAHGEINPSNILLGKDGHPRLLEFAGRPLGSTGDGSGSSLGIPVYMAPEHIRGEPVEPRGDVYGLGVVLYEALTSNRPFSGNSVVQVFEQVLNQSPKPPRRIVRSIPAALEAICLKAIAKDPAQRHPTAGDLAAALRAFLEPPRRRGFWK